MTIYLSSALDTSFPLPPDRPFTRSRAREAGVADKVLRLLVENGVMRRPARGVYVDAALPDSIELRCAILRLVVPTGYVVCDRTAGWLYVGDRVLGPNEHREVPPISCFARTAGKRLRNDLTSSGERTILDRELHEVHGLVVTTPLRTALDLGRLAPSADLRLAGMDAMLSLRCFELEELLAEVPRFKGQRGVVLLRPLSRRADGGAASFGESALRNRWLDAGLPRPRTQVPIERDGRVPFQLDMGIEAEQLGGEYDGEEFHGPEQVQADRDRRDYVAGRGWTVPVFRKSHVFGRWQNAEQRLRQAWTDVRASNRNRTHFT